MALELYPDFNTKIKKEDINRLFVTDKEFDFINHISAEFMQRIQGQFVFYIPIDREKTIPNSYGESKQKIVKGGQKVKLPASIKEIVTPINDNYGIRHKKELRVAFLQKLNEAYGVNDIFMGDYLEWSDKKYEIINIKRERKVYGQDEYYFEIICSCEARE